MSAPRGDRRRKEPVAAVTDARVAAETAAMEASEAKEEVEERDPDGGSTLSTHSGGDDDPTLDPNRAALIRALIELGIAEGQLLLLC